MPSITFGNFSRMLVGLGRRAGLVVGRWCRLNYALKTVDEWRYSASRSLSFRGVTCA